MFLLVTFWLIGGCISGMGDAIPVSHLESTLGRKVLSRGEAVVLMLLPAVVPCPAYPSNVTVGHYQGPIHYIK